MKAVLLSQRKTGIAGTADKVDRADREEKADRVGKKKVEDRFEWFIFKAFLAAFILLIAAQTALLSPSVRLSIPDNYSDDCVEGELLKKEAYLFVPCKMELKLINIDNCPDLMVLVNGVKMEVFNSNTVLLELKDGDVVELDASMVLIEAKVQISAVSENIAGILGKTMSVTDGITLVSKVKTLQ